MHYLGERRRPLCDLAPLRVVGIWHSQESFSTVLAPRRAAEVPALAAPAATAAAGPTVCDDGGVVSDETNNRYVVSALAGIYNGEHALVAQVNLPFSNSLCSSRDQIDILCSFTGDISNRITKSCFYDVSGHGWFLALTRGTITRSTIHDHYVWVNNSRSYVYGRELLVLQASRRASL